MIKVKLNKLSLNDILYDTGDSYDSHHELKEIVIKSLKLDDKILFINDYYRLFYNANEDYYVSYNLYFSKKKATNVVNEYIRQQNKRKEKYAKEKEIEEKYKQQIIDDKLEEKYIGKTIMINRGKNGWVKRRCEEIRAFNTGIYLYVNDYGHICKLSREGHTWKMWSELEELEIQKEKLEKRIDELKLLEKDDNNEN